MIFIGNFPCSVDSHHVALYAFVQGETFVAAYCEACAKESPYYHDLGWAPMDDVYVRFALHRKYPKTGTSWTAGLGEVDL